MVKKAAKKKPAKEAVKKAPRVCPECGKVHPVRKNLGISAAREEVESLILLNSRFNTAAQAAQPVNAAPDVTKEQIQVFVNAALGAKAEAAALQRQWWTAILAKYKNLPGDKNVFVDFNTGEFYVLEQP